jgi:hypothetical protein
MAKQEKRRQERVLSCFFVKTHLSAVIFAILIILVEKKQ